MKNICMLIVVCFSTTLFITAEAYPDIIWTPQYNYHGEIIEETPEYVTIRIGSRDKKIPRDKIDDITYVLESPPAPSTSSKNADINKFTLLEERVSDIPVKCQVDLDILVSEEVTEKVLTDILNALYKQAQGKSGFKYHKHPTHIAIFAYVSKEHLDLGQWIGMLSQIGLGKKPNITTNVPQKQPAPLNDSREIW